MKHVGALFASFHCVLQSVRNTVEVVEVLHVHFREILIVMLVEMLKRPALHQLGIHPKCRIWNSTGESLPLGGNLSATQVFPISAEIEAEVSISRRRPSIPLIPSHLSVFLKTAKVVPATACFPSAYHQECVC